MLFKNVTQLIFICVYNTLRAKEKRIYISLMFKFKSWVNILFIMSLLISFTFGLIGEAKCGGSTPCHSSFWSNDGGEFYRQNQINQRFEKHPITQFIIDVASLSASASNNNNNK